MTFCKNIFLICAVSVTISCASASVSTATEQTDHHADIKTQMQKAAFGGSVAYMLLLAFVAGLLVSFTPCVYPMIPITLGILQSQATQSVSRNFMLTFSYVLGLAAVHATLGYIAATTSIVFGQWLANPWFILFMILFFLYFAFSMFGFYEIYMPRFLSSSSQGSPRGSLLSSFLFGVISGTAASPCLTPVLAVILGFVAHQGSPLFGVAALFLFALGMGTLLIVVGTFSGMLVLLPRAGMWMESVKKVFGFMMLAACVYIAKPILNDMVSIALYAAIGIGAIVYFVTNLRK